MIPKELKKQMLEVADRYDEPILFKDDIQVSYYDVTLKWSNGEIISYTFVIVPVVKDDQKTIELQTRLESTRTKPPSLHISAGLS